MNQSLLDVIEMDLGSPGNLLTVYINVHDSSLSRKWLTALNELINKQYHLEKNYCFFGFADGERNGAYLIDQINTSKDLYKILDMCNNYDFKHSANKDKEIQLATYCNFNTNTNKQTLKTLLTQSAIPV